MCDELDSLGTVAGIADANTRGRKYGLCSVGAIQSKAQLDATYGPLGAQTLLSTFSSKITFRQGSWSDAEYWSNEFGQREITEQSISKASTSGNGGTETETIAQARKIVQTILPSQLAELSDRVAYCRFPGMAGIHQIEFDIRKYKPIRPAFLPHGEPEPEFEDPKVEVVKKAEEKEEPVRIPWGPVAGVVALGLVGWFLISPPEWLANPKKGTTVAPYVAAPPQGPKFRVFHWTPETFRCRTDHSTGERPWACVRVGPPRLPITKKHTAGIPAGSPVDPVMSLPVWTGPWPPWWHCLPKNGGKWVAVNRPVRDRYGNWYSGIVGQKRERMRVRCPK